MLVCTGKECKYAVLPIHINSHLSSACHNYNPEQRKHVINEVQQIPGLIRDTRELQWFQFPEPSSPAIPELKPAKEGFQCKTCRYICCTQVGVRNHCTAVHQWKNERKKGRPSYKKRQSEPERPWISGVHCQQFFIQGPKSQLFEVRNEERIQAAIPIPITDIWAKV
jgi:Orsellinic acid/F9775 biosynthesis cluster protein D